MAKKIRILALLLAFALVLTGCGLRTVDQLYCLPKRSEADHDLQAVIDKAMDGLQYVTPIYSDIRQVVQEADLDGDGVNEYILCARDNSEKPLKILIFCQLASGYVLMDTIEGYGFAFDFLEFAQMDDKPGLELIVGRQLTDQMIRSVSVYRFSGGFSRQLLSTGYARMVTCDLNSDGISELFLLNGGESEGSNGTAVLYSYSGGDFGRTVQLPLSRPISDFRRIMLSTMRGNIPAVYVTMMQNQTTLSTDVFAIMGGEFCVAAQSILTASLHNYYVYPEDINHDGVLDLPEPVEVDRLDPESHPEYLLRWYSLDREGNSHLVTHTYHEMEQNWYFRVDNTWADRLCIQQEEHVTSFYLAGEGGWTKLFSITVLTDADRLEQSQLPGRLVLYSNQSVICVADLEPAAAEFGITDAYLIARFTPIRVEIITEED